MVLFSCIFTNWKIQIQGFIIAMVAVTQILFVFVKMFKKSREENEKQAEAEKKRLEKEAMKERAAANLSAKKEGVDGEKPKHNFQIHKHLQ